MTNLTLDQIKTLRGSELDAAVAEARGWRDIYRDSSPTHLYWGINPHGGKQHSLITPWSSSIAFAWELVEEMQEPEIWKEPDGKWRARSACADEMAEAATAPTAIARAYLMAACCSGREERNSHETST